MNTNGSFVDLGVGVRGFLSVPPSAGPHPAVIVNMEAFGVNAYIQSECSRLARDGYVALAPDYYRGETLPYDDMARVLEKLKALDHNQVQSELAAAIAYLDTQANVRSGPFGVVGFCVGGYISFRAAAERGEKIAAAACFYGSGIAPDEARSDRPTLLERVPEIKAALSLHYGADDQSILPSEHGRLATALSAAKKEYGIHVYRGAGHGFASVDRDSYQRDIAEEAWAETIEFFSRRLV